MTEVFPLNQVAGNTRLLKDLSASHVYKRLDEQEAIFYERLQKRSKLLPFCAKYYGIEDCVNNKETNGFISQWSERMKKKERHSGHDQSEMTDKQIMKDQTRLHKQMSELGPNSLVQRSLIHQQIKTLSDQRLHLGCNQTWLQSINKTKYIVLENLTNGYRKPSILDLKLGTRQHRDTAPLDKIDRMVSKCGYTTSSSLGIRLCGMQVYTKESGFIHKDKYSGRQLSEEFLQKEIGDFFTRDCDLINFFVNRLRTLYCILEQEENYRLYSTSLLFVWEGDEEYEKSLKDLRLIDFAHSYLDQHEGQDEGALFGIRNLIALLEDLLQKLETLDNVVGENSQKL